MIMEGLGYGINKGSSGIFCPPCSRLYRQMHTDSSGALGLAGRGAPCSQDSSVPWEGQVSQTGGANNLWRGNKQEKLKKDRNSQSGGIF